MSSQFDLELMEFIRRQSVSDDVVTNNCNTVTAFEEGLIRSVASYHGIYNR